MKKSRKKTWKSIFQNMKINNRIILAEVLLDSIDLKEAQEFYKEEKLNLYNERLAKIVEEFDDVKKLKKFKATISKLKLLEDERKAKVLFNLNSNVRDLYEEQKKLEKSLKH